METIKNIAIIGIFLILAFIAETIAYQNNFLVRSECAWENQEMSYNTKENPVHLVKISECK